MVVLKSSSGSVPLSLLRLALSSLSMEQLPRPEGILPLMGICPIKLLLLALRAIKFRIPFHVVDVNCPVNMLLEMLSTCRGWGRWVEDCRSCRSPLSWLKLTSRLTMLLDNTNSSGRPPESELPVRLPRDGVMRPSRPLDGSETSMTVLFPLQVTPSHLQQSVTCPCHDFARPESCESPARNWRRDVFSCSVQELAGVAKELSSTRTTARTCTSNLLLYFMYEKWSDRRLPIESSMEARCSSCVSYLGRLAEYQRCNVERT
ncbi:hypothetical protein U9M48_025665 [Paspalum notatum var. saurae]|uniref:Uncharacterized protein n=1 Tax=Paspalum notatum var. saurae TaxID=547442 RepID=A0AAQ3TVF8_PASNO